MSLRALHFKVNLGYSYDCYLKSIVYMNTGSSWSRSLDCNGIDLRNSGKIIITKAGAWYQQCENSSKYKHNTMRVSFSLLTHTHIEPVFMNTPQARASIHEHICTSSQSLWTHMHTMATYSLLHRNLATNKVFWKWQMECYLCQVSIKSFFFQTSKHDR